MDVFEDSSILTEKQRLKPKDSSSLKFFASFDTLLDPRDAKVRNEMIRVANTPVCPGALLGISTNFWFDAADAPGHSGGSALIWAHSGVPR